MDEQHTQEQLLQSILQELKDTRGDLAEQHNTVVQLTTQNDLLQQQLAQTNDYLGSVTEAVIFVSMMAAFFVAFAISKGRN